MWANPCSRQASLQRRGSHSFQFTSGVLLKIYHDSLMGSHLGDLKTYLLIASEWLWPRMRNTIALYVQACSLPCMSAAQILLSCSPVGLLKSFTVPSQVWEDISMDIGRLPCPHGVDSMLVVVDLFIRYAHFVGLNPPYTVPTVAKIFMRRVRLHTWHACINSQ